MTFDDVGKDARVRKWADWPTTVWIACLGQNNMLPRKILDP
jgi:hypothetical protein